MVKYALIASLCGSMGLFGWVTVLQGQKARLAEENAALTRSVATWTEAAAQASRDLELEAARYEAEQKRSAEFMAVIDQLQGRLADAPLDPDLVDLLNGRRVRSPH